MAPENLIVASSALTNNKHAAVDTAKVSLINYRGMKAIGRREYKVSEILRILCKISRSYLDNLNPQH